MAAKRLAALFVFGFVGATVMDAAVSDENKGAESWADWAENKFSGGGINVDSGKAISGAQRLAEKAEDAAVASTDAINSAAFESSKLASEKLNRALDGSESGNVAAAGDSYDDAKAKVKERYASLSAEAKQTYEAAKHKASQTIGIADL